MTRTLILTLTLTLTIACDLDDADLTIESTSDDATGYEVAGGFHVEVDSQSDIAVASLYDDTVYFFSTITSGGTIDTTNATGKFVGEAGGEAGWSMDVGPLVGSDLIGVLLQDIVIGAPSEESGKGRVYLLEGGTLATTTTATGYVTFVGEQAGDYAGWDVAVGDFNGDDIKDVLIGACGDDTNANFAGAAYVIRGPFSSRKGTEIELKDADIIVRGETAGGGFGCQVAAGDLNNDGSDEIIVGASGEHNGSTIGDGSVYAIFELGDGEVDTSNLGPGTVKWTGLYETQNLGSSLDAGQDYNGDGIDDLIVSGWHWGCRQAVDEGGSCISTINPGEAYLVLGVTQTRIQSIHHSGGKITNDTNVRFSSNTVGADFGIEASMVGDVNGDSYDDIAIGAKGEDNVYIWLGRPESASYWISAADDTEANMTIDGSGQGGGVGWSVRPGGDMNSDGRGELLIGSPGFDWYGETAIDGRADVFLGSTTSF